MAGLLDKNIDPRQRIRDVSTVLTYLRMAQTPAATMLSKGKRPRSTLYEWRAKTRHAPSDNAIAEGVDVQADEIINNSGLKKMLQGRTQKSRVAIGVDDIAEELGEEFEGEGGQGGSQIADNVKDALVLSKENLEVTLLKGGDSQGPIDNNNPRKLRGLVGWIRSANPNDGDLPIPASCLCPAGNILTGQATAADVTEEELLDIMQSIATACRDNKNLHVFVTPALKRQISSWLKLTPEVAGKVVARRFVQDLKAAEIMMTVDRVRCDFGTFFLHVHWTLPAGVHAIFIDLTMASIRPVKTAQVRSIEYRGGYHIRIIESVQGLEVTNPQSHGKITT